MSPPKGATTREVAEAAGVSNQTVLRWAERGVLPPVKVTYGGRVGKRSTWPPHAPEQARWVADQLAAGVSFAEIRAKLEAGEFKGSS